MSVFEVFESFELNLSQEEEPFTTGRYFPILSVSPKQTSMVLFLQVFLATLSQFVICWCSKQSGFPDISPFLPQDYTRNPQPSIVRFAVLGQTMETIFNSVLCWRFFRCHLDHFLCNFHCSSWSGSSSSSYNLGYVELKTPLPLLYLNQFLDQLSSVTAWSRNLELQLLDCTGYYQSAFSVLPLNVLKLMILEALKAEAMIQM